jgi:hypothetical protein
MKNKKTKKIEKLNKKNLIKKTGLLAIGGTMANIISIFTPGKPWL